jgi:hypothetical protein
MALKRPLNGILRTRSGGRISLMASTRIIMKRCMEIDEVSHITIAEYPTKAIRSKSSMISKDILKMGLRVC